MRRFIKFSVPDSRAITAWAQAGNVILPHSKRCNTYREDTAPWLNEPINAIRDSSFVSICKPTQSGGTTGYEVFLAWLLANQPRDVAMMGQTDSDAEDLFRSKILPTLKASPATAPIILSAGRNDITKTRMDLPSMDFRVHGPSINSMQSRSVEVLLLDEAWRFDLGVIGEILERTSTVEATRKIVTVSQAGEEIEDKYGRACFDEWGQWWHRGTQELYNVKCRSCGSFYYPETADFKCDEKARDEETKVWNWKKVRETVYHTTPCCKTRIENTARERRRFTKGAKYIATNDNAEARHRSFRYSSWVVYWQDWAGLLEQFLRAQDALKRGDISPLKIWTQKKESAWWRLKDSEIPVVNTKDPSGYTVETYEPKEGKEVLRIDNEVKRFAAFDMQRDRFPLAIRAFTDGSSKLLYYGEPQTIEEGRQIVEAYGVEPKFTGFDVGNWSGTALRYCWLNKWTPLRGRSVNNFTRVRGRGKAQKIPYQDVTERLTGEKIYSQSSKIKVWEWSNTHFKDIFSRLRAMPEHMIPDDIDQGYIDAMESERKDLKSGRWVQIGSRANHAWDCDVMVTFMAYVYKLVGEARSEGE